MPPGLVRFLLALVAAGLALLSEAPPARAAASLVDEYSVKAAFLYNFSKFTDWPSDSLAAPDFRIGVVGRDPFGERLVQVVAGKQVHGRAIDIRYPKSAGEMTACDVLFIAASEEGRLGEILAVLAGRPILTVSEGKAFVNHGGMIRLKLADNRVRFEINVVASDAAHLRLSSQLLRLADGVHRSPGEKP